MAFKGNLSVSNGNGMMVKVSLLALGLLITGPKGCEIMLNVQHTFMNIHTGTQMDRL